VAAKIVEGRLSKFYAETCLLEQPFVKDPDLTIEKLLQQLVSKTGENVRIRRFVRFAVGDE
jgi:elongation factor Ts